MVRRLREESSGTQAELAQRACVSQPYLSQIETGMRGRVQVSDRPASAMFLGVPVTALLSRQDEHRYLPIGQTTSCGAFLWQPADVGEPEAPRRCWRTEVGWQTRPLSCRQEPHSLPRGASAPVRALDDRVDRHSWRRTRPPIPASALSPPHCLPTVTPERPSVGAVTMVTVTPGPSRSRLIRHARY
jgi:transcriptional regulator with XRE-family HTH domain